METRKCPFCGGTMVPSKTDLLGHARYFWVPPWKSRLTGLLKPGVKGRPWLCINCGAVVAYVDEKKLSILREEYEQKKLEGSI